MPRIAVERSAKWVASLTKPGLHAVGGVSGLCLQVVSKDSRSWVLRAVMPGGGRRSYGLGPFPQISLAEARDAARQARAGIRDQVDPIDARRTAKAARQKADAAVVTFRSAAATYIAAHEDGWRNPKHTDQWRATLATYAYPVMGDLPVADVDTPHVLKVLEPMWSNDRANGGRLETASRLRGRIECILDWATARGLRTKPNCARWKGHLAMMLAKPSKLRSKHPRKHHRALPVNDVANFMLELAKVEGVSAQCLSFVTRTACRSGEARGARWSEFKLDATIPTWCIPGERMKAGRPHFVPLSKQVVALLKAMPRYEHTDLVFPSPQSYTPLCDAALGELMKRMKAEGVPHGMRSTFRVWAAERTDYPREVAEAALAHVNGDLTEAAYLRTTFFERRARMMQDYADFLDRPVVAERAGNVFEIGARAM